MKFDFRMGDFVPVSFLAATVLLPLAVGSEVEARTERLRDKSGPMNADASFGAQAPFGRRPLAGNGLQRDGEQGWRSTANRPPAAAAGQDCVARVGENVEFHGQGSSADEEVAEYAWDFESDGVVDFSSPSTGTTTHVFRQPGDYRCIFTVRDSTGQVARSVRRVVVVSREAVLPSAEPSARPAALVRTNPPDGFPRRHVVLFNGGSEARYWTDVTLAYAMLTNGYGFAPADIFLLNYDGTNPDSQNPGGMIDFPATLSALRTVFSNLTVIADADDELFLWITDHGRGYTGPRSEGGKYLGYLDGRASVDPGDEADFAEADFKVRSLFTGGDYRCNHGLDVWKVRREYRTATKTEYYRNKFVSHFHNVRVAGLGTVSDNDVFIERFVDYLQGDTNRDGIIDTATGERMDYDGDGVPPYNPATGVFDEDDWGEIDLLEDDYNFVNTQLPVGAHPYQLFDNGLTGKLCIDLAYDGVHLQVDGRDEDGQGLFDWMDVNQDGDTNDIVSVDEAVCGYGNDIYDDDWRALLAPLSVARITIVAEPCFSGGLVEDLSGPGRVICTATIEDAVSWGNIFIRGFVAALHGRDEYGSAVDADANGNGEVSMLEAFNYAAGRDTLDEIPQYDDNGDSASQTDPVPAGGEGSLGADTYLRVVVPVITGQPQDVAANAGATVAFSVLATGSAPRFYQWWCNGFALADAGNVSGARSDQLILSNVQPAQAGNYAVVVSNRFGTITSSNAFLTVFGPIQALVNAASSGQTIFIPAGTYQDHVVVDKDLILQGEGTNGTIVEGPGVGAVFDLGPEVSVTLSNLVIQNGLVGVRVQATGRLAAWHCLLTSNRIAGLDNAGRAQLFETRVVANGTDASGEEAHAVRNRTGASLLLSNCIVAQNVAWGDGAGIFNGGQLELWRTQVQDNWGEQMLSHGGLVNHSTGRVAQCALHANGEGNVLNTGLLVLESTLLTGRNLATRGIWNLGTVRATNCTISGCGVDCWDCGEGGGVENRGLMTLWSSTVVSNRASDGSGVSAGGGIRNVGTLELGNTLVADNLADTAPDLAGAVWSQGWNLIQDASGCSLVGVTMGNILGRNPLLGPLQENGGPTRTHALLPGSPALDAGCSTNFPSDDQRGLLRPRAGAGPCVARPDIGAFEKSDNGCPLELLPDGAVQLWVQVPPQEACVLGASSNLVDWVNLCTNLDGGTFFFRDVQAQNCPCRFYHVRPLP